jgi:hypothetical protein
MKGRILKIKTGYNPNSSSIGVDMIVFFTAGAAVTVLFNTMAAVLCSAKVRKEARALQPEAQAALVKEQE